MSIFGLDFISFGSREGSYVHLGEGVCLSILSWDESGVSHVFGIGYSLAGSFLGLHFLLLGQASP